MPRTNGAHEGFRRDRDDDDRPRRGNGPRTQRADLDQQVLTLRETGSSYAAVARTLGIKRAAEAQAAFIRAIRGRPEEERAALTQRESDRLDILEKRIRDRDTADPEKMERRLVALEKLRQALG